MSEQLIDSNTNTQPFNNTKPVNEMRPFKEVPRIEDMPFLDNMRLFEKGEKDKLNSTPEIKEIEVPQPL